MKQTQYLVAAAGLLVLGAIFLVSSNYSARFFEENETQVVISHAQYAYNPADTELLVENSSNIFVGKVAERIEDVQRSSGRFTSPQFAVDVIESIKGSTGEKVVIRQGEVRYRDGQMYVTEGDVSNSQDVAEGYLLEPGATYVFVTMFDSNQNIHAISMREYDRKLITSNSSLTQEQLVALAAEDERVKEFRSASAE